MRNGFRTRYHSNWYQMESWIFRIQYYGWKSSFDFRQDFFLVVNFIAQIWKKCMEIARFERFGENRYSVIPSFSSNSFWARRKLNFWNVIFLWFSHNTAGQASFEVAIGPFAAAIGSETRYFDWTSWKKRPSWDLKSIGSHRKIQRTNADINRGTITRIFAQTLSQSQWIPL